MNNRHRSYPKQSSVGVTTFVAGALLGIGAGMLFAPKRGEEIRSDIKDMGEKAKYKLFRTKESVRHRLADARLESAERAREARERLESKLREMQPEEYE